VVPEEFKDAHPKHIVIASILVFCFWPMWVFYFYEKSMKGKKGESNG
jgi:hypothetical protein